MTTSATGKRATSAPIVVVGAGAAGLAASIHAAVGPRRVILLERTADGGRKILISGGGRCNVLPSELAPKRFVTASSPNTLRKILLSWPLAEQRRFFEKRMGLGLELEEETGKLFPATNRARDVRDGLVRLAREAGVEVRFGAMVMGIERSDGRDASVTGGEWIGSRASRTDDPPGERPAASSSGSARASSPLADPGDARWEVRLGDGSTVLAHSVVLATGGLSVPATGSDGTGLRITRQLGHEMHDTYPALTPLTADPPVHAHLAGVSLTVTLTAPSERLSTTGGFLFTHRGYSGPTVLDVSHVAVRARVGLGGGSMSDSSQHGVHSADDSADRASSGSAPSGSTSPGVAVSSSAAGGSASAGHSPRAAHPIQVQWTADGEAAWNEQLTSGGASLVGGVLRRALPQRLADALLHETGVDPATPLSQMRRADRARLVGALTRYPLPWTGDEGYKKAEVTGGGVALSEVDPATLESRRCPGLYLCGEMLDAFGPIGGHNFSWAFSTGRLAGKALAESIDLS